MSTLVKSINDAKVDPSMTFPQGSYLYGLTGRKFWEVTDRPKPSVEQAALLIEACIQYKKDQSNGTEVQTAIRIWFPDFELEDIKERGGSKSQSSGPRKRGGGGARKRTETTKPEATKEPETSPETEAKPEPEKEPETQAKSEPEKPAPRPTKKAKVKLGGTANEIQQHIDAGFTNIWLFGPAGCGKTTICRLAAEAKSVNCTVISCGAGTSPTTFTGYRFPEREATAFVKAYGEPGIIVIDEFPALEAEVAQSVNAALANGVLDSTMGEITRHPECIIIATGNTTGTGADRMYVSNHQLDGSTLDRFAGAMIPVDYDPEYEKQYDAEVLRYIRKMREAIGYNGLRKIASTRLLQAGHMLKKAGKDWKTSLTINWSEDEKALLR